MALNPSAFEYLKPTDQQVQMMSIIRGATLNYALCLENVLPDGPDKTYALRKVREIGMWANVATTREADGTPRPYQLTACSSARLEHLIWSQGAAGSNPATQTIPESPDEPR